MLQIELLEPHATIEVSASPHAAAKAVCPYKTEIAKLTATTDF